MQTGGMQCGMACARLRATAFLQTTVPPTDCEAVCLTVGCLFLYFVCVLPGSVLCLQQLSVPPCTHQPANALLWAANRCMLPSSATCRHTRMRHSSSSSSSRS
jgi:hypothetical protein